MRVLQDRRAAGSACQCWNPVDSPAVLLVTWKKGRGTLECPMAPSSAAAGLDLDLSAQRTAKPRSKR